MEAVKEPRHTIGWLAAVLLIPAIVLAETPEDWERLLDELEDAGEFPEWLDEPLPWLVLPSARAGVGYRDNVMLGEVSRQGGTFLTWGFDTVLASPPGDRHLFNLLLTADYHRFYPRDRFTDEFFGFANTQLETKVSSASILVLGADAYHVRQRVDITTVEILEAESDPMAVDMIGGGVKGRACWRRDFGETLSATAGYGAGWHYYRSPLEDYRETGPRLDLDWTPANDWELSLGLENLRRDYDGREARKADGVFIPGSSLRFELWRADLTSRRQWRFEHGRLTVAPRLGVEVNRDNGGRYHDYTRWRTGQRIEYATGAWRFAARGGISYFEYDRQTAGNGSDSPRRRWPWEWEIEASRKLTETARAHLRFDREGASGNQSSGRYRVNTVKTGVQWDF